MGEERSQWIMVSPLANFDSATTIELEVAGVGYAYADPAHMLLYTKEKIVNADGSDITDADNSDATLVNYGMHAQWSQVDASINGLQKIHISNSVCGTRTRLDTTTPWIATRTWGSRGIVHTLMRSRTKLSREFEMMGPLHLDICNTDRLLLNNCTLRLKLTRSRDAFALMSTKGTEKIKLLDVKLFIRRVTISPSVLLAHAQALEKSPAKYPRVIIGFVDNRAFNGDYARNPFRFQHFSLNYLQMHVDGQPVPSQPLTPDFSKDLYMECYNTLFTGTGIHWKDEGNGISWSNYPKGNTLIENRQVAWLFSTKSIFAAVDYVRKDKKPKPPTTFEEVDDIFNNPDFAHPGRTLDDGAQLYQGKVGPDGEESLVFASPRALKMMLESDVVASDATFEITPRLPGALQVMIFAVFTFGHALPIATVVMQSKTEAAYTAVIQHLRQLGLKFRTAITDWEEPEWNAWRTAFPGIQVYYGCVWHFIRAAEKKRT
ncbi:hypothetical protein KUF71_017335 [Frankliniella fusca]|uniref:MULE transposase domain-containing protein n=1 Tax=Frankliniella fusca TaxID=407009 RepID=A0AAE1I4A0_9NEOP|nr:hypothetical protein KUF71_017335 [Frankliniella fusca]